MVKYKLENTPNKYNYPKTWLCVLEDDDTKECSKCHEKLKIGDWIRIHHYYSHDEHGQIISGKIYHEDTCTTEETTGKLCKIVDIDGGENID